MWMANSDSTISAFLFGSAFVFVIEIISELVNRIKLIIYVKLNS